VTDLLLLALTAALSWGMWRAIERYEAGVGRWLWVWAMWVARMMRSA